MNIVLFYYLFLEFQYKGGKLTLLLCVGCFFFCLFSVWISVPILNWMKLFAFHVPFQFQVNSYLISDLAAL